MKRAILPLLGLMAACGPRPVTRPERQTGYRVTLRAVADDSQLVTVGGVRLERQEFFYDAVIPRKTGAPCRISGKGDLGFAWYGLEQVGEVEFLPSGKKRALVVGTDAGSGLDSVYLSLIDAAACQASGLTIATPSAKIYAQRLESWGPSHAQDERAFLSDMKFRYGYEGKEPLDAHKDNPKFAYRFWERDNGNITEGPMRLRRYKGAPQELASIEARLSDERYDFLAEFKAGVLAYDRKLDEHFVIFHPTTIYHWPTAIVRAGRWLAIGTRGDGVALIDMAGWKIKRVTFGGGPDDDVKSLEAVAGGVRVNGKVVLKL